MPSDGPKAKFRHLLREETAPRPPDEHMPRRRTAGSRGPQATQDATRISPEQRLSLPRSSETEAARSDA
jgi:hypothetical protein